MKIDITGRHIEVTPALKKFAEEKLGKLEKLLDHEMIAHVVLWVTKHRHIAEIQIKSGHLVLSSTEETDDLYASIREVVSHLERQLHRHKEKIQDHKHKRGPRDPEVAATIEANASEEAAQQEEAAGDS